jgi:anti-sigma regulatory factor (Ser/Thr protein kinase)
MSGFTLRFPSSPASVAPARAALCDYAREAGFFGASLSDFETAIGEALANAVEHGHREGSFFTVRARATRGTFEVEIADNGRGFRDGADGGRVRPPSDSPRGFGLFIMRSLMDDVAFADGGTVVRLTKRLPATLDLDEERGA